VLSITTIVLAFTVLAAGDTFTVGTSQYAKTAGMGTGFYVWIGSFVLILLASWIKFKKR